MARTIRNRIAAAVKCNRMAEMEAKPPDPIRDLAIEIVDIFAGLLREEEMRDAFVEVYERIKGRLSELKGKE
jgi:hypothetical protein